MDGDDLADDTAALAAAIAAAARESPATLLLPRGDLFVHDAPPLDAAAVDLRGIHAVVLEGHGRNATRIVLRDSSPAHVLAITDARSVEIRRMTILGAGTASPTGHGIRIASSVGVGVRDVAIQQASHYGIGVQRGTVTLEIERVEIRDTGADGIDVKEVGGTATVSIRSVQVARPGLRVSGQAAFDLRGDVRLREVTAVGVPDGATGFRFRGGSSNGRAASGASLVGFRVEASDSATGIDVAADGVRIARGTVLGSWTGVRIGGRRTRLRDVHVDGSSGFGFRETDEARETVAVDCSSTRGRRGWWMSRQARLVRPRATSHDECDVCDPSR